MQIALLMLTQRGHPCCLPFIHLLYTTEYQFADAIDSGTTFSRVVSDQQTVVQVQRDSLVESQPYTGGY